jgi:hypothetical protein
VVATVCWTRRTGAPGLSIAIRFFSLGDFARMVKRPCSEVGMLAPRSSGQTNAEGTVQTRTIDLLTADEFRNSNPGASRDGPVVAMNVYRRAK